MNCGTLATQNLGGHRRRIVAQRLLDQWVRLGQLRQRVGTTRNPGAGEIVRATADAGREALSTLRLDEAHQRDDKG